MLFSVENHLCYSFIPECGGLNMTGDFKVVCTLIKVQVYTLTGHQDADDELAKTNILIEIGHVWFYHLCCYSVYSP